ncbi:MAG: GGDEF domain-containing protein [Butyrivibrio sp.]|nr:GGDEF domain-containing protein [Butyrivibrio sp.]
MNIGLLISELEDKEVKKICIGACQAAKDLDITLVLLPGKYLISDNSLDEEHPYNYQYTALYDYANTSDFDALVIDAERIGSKTTILRKEAFLKKFENVPVLTLSEQEGFMSVNIPDTDQNQFEQLGYESIFDAVFYVKNQVLPPVQPPQRFTFVEKSETEAFGILAEVNYTLLQRKYDTEEAYRIFAKKALSHGIKSCGILLYNKKNRNTIKYPWEKPEKISIKSAIINGSEVNFEDENMQTATDKIFSTFSQDKSGIFIAGTIFVGEYQLGLLVSEFTESFLIEHYFDSVISTVTGVSRLAYLEKELAKTRNELYEVQEELARDDSVLDHIGDQDYLTGGLNRRGFFAKAYDLLKDEFTPGRYALVAYIHMESLKRINDMFGHEEGDRAVKRVAEALEEVFGDSIYGRIRGDEFAVILIDDEEGKAEALRLEMSTQNSKLLSEANRYINHLQYAVCEFSYEENLSLREMLKETDESLQRIKGL